MQIEALNPKAWYELAKNIVDDLRSATFKERDFRFNKYEELFRCIRITHIDYVNMFQNFIDSLYTFEDSPNLKKVKREFLEARKIHSSGRVIQKFDALSLITAGQDVLEERYLFSCAWYFHYLDTNGYVGLTRNHLDMNLYLIKSDKNGGDGSWDSASMRFWHEIEKLEDAGECQRVAREFLNSLNSRFLAIVQSFSEMEADVRFGKQLPPTEFAKLPKEKVS